LRAEVIFRLRDSGIAKVSRLQAGPISLLCLVLALSDAIVLEQMELVDFQKPQRLYMMDLCARDLNEFNMV